MRFVAEQRASGRKASRPKDIKRILSEKKLRSDVTSTSTRIRWAGGGPGAGGGAVVLVMRDGMDYDVQVDQGTTATTVLEVS